MSSSCAVRDEGVDATIPEEKEEEVEDTSEEEKYWSVTPQWTHHTIPG